MGHGFRLYHVGCRPEAVALGPPYTLPLSPKIRMIFPSFEASWAGKLPTPLRPATRKTWVLNTEASQLGHDQRAGARSCRVPS